VGGSVAFAGNYGHGPIHWWGYNTGTVDMKRIRGPRKFILTQIITTCQYGTITIYWNAKPTFFFIDISGQVKNAKPAHSNSPVMLGLMAREAPGLHLQCMTNGVTH